MLYATTRNAQEAYTAQRALTENRGPDGGLYVPFREPSFSEEMLESLLEMPARDCMAQVLNPLFRKQLTGWDIELAVGKHPVRLESLNQKLLVAELWRNLDWCYDGLVKRLAQCLGVENPGNWTQTAIGAAIVFALCAQLHQMGYGTVDFAMVAGEMTLPMSAWYARRWGAPLGNLVLCCNENSGLWELLSHGQFHTDALAVTTTVPEADIAVPVGLERLVAGCGGSREAERYLDDCRLGQTYAPPETVLSAMRQGLYVSVVSSQRLESVIPGAKQTHGYDLPPAAALCYAGVQDYRAKTGQTNPVVILAENNRSNK